MKAYEIQGELRLDQVALTERPTPVPGPNQVLVRIRAVSLNARDLGVIGGFYAPDLPLPFVPASDGVGEVVETGDRVSRFRIGERVSGIFAQQWLSGEPLPAYSSSTLGSPLPGVLAEYAVFDEDGLVAVPAYLSDAEAAALPCAGVTAWHAIVSEGAVKAGDTVVVQGTGGVSLFALQFAKLHGAVVIVTSSSDAKLERAIALGADYGINYRDQPDWSQAVLARTDGRGADHVLDLGGASTLNQSIAAVRFGGRVSVVGILSGMQANAVHLIAIIQKKIRLQGINVGSREMFEAMNRALAASGLKPVIDREFPFEQAVDALRYLEKGAHFGKIVITVP
ncbi:zinc-dependent alcohol dehydrogenase family protein [Paenibacillus arenilitoris]|uniref:NAD(P)-dependent alcohol dehydrogenase n=1 Tax=Paenibacillus arenilitoris TaxID=2772299 RepID=A0A927CLZ5_9BACL|nr:NAD(P)-dependent alcohol dehydrogenase [Paenibacillus arenilitoris]MBD2869033.1 NAD(P)-dependent alcohol dehydrogenase [Paenibacillus arenilitoris]